jgi:phage tail tube protein FII
MEERKNTLVCTFDPKSPCLTAFEIHEWIHEQLQVDDEKVTMVQIGGTKWQVFMKFSDPTYAQTIVQHTTGSVICKHSNGEISTVQVNMAGLGTKRVRVANVPPETTPERIRIALTPYGEVRDVQDWMELAQDRDR